MLAGAAMGLSSLTVVLNADLACGLDRSDLTRRAFERLRIRDSRAVRVAARDSPSRRLAVIAWSGRNPAPV